MYTLDEMVYHFHTERVKLSFFLSFLLSSFCCLFLCVLLTVSCVPQAHLHVVGMLRFMSDINQPSLPTPFYSVLVSVSSFMAFSIVFRSINSPDNSLRSHSVLPVLILLYWYL